METWRSRDDNEYWEHVYSALSKAVEKAALPEAIEKCKKTFKAINHQQGEKNSRFGVRHRGMNKDGITKRIPLDQVDKFLQKGWKFGFAKKIVRPFSHRSGTACVSKNNERKRISIDKLPEYLELGWSHGWGKLTVE